MIFNNLLRFITDPSNDYPGHSLDYIKLCAAAIVLAIIIGIVVGVLVVRNPLASFVAINLSGLMRAIPVLAFLAAAYPFLGFGFLPALMALAILGIPPILLNTYTGIRGVDAAMIDAARGMGYSNSTRFTRRCRWCTYRSSTDCSHGDPGGHYWRRWIRRIHLSWFT